MSAYYKSSRPKLLGDDTAEKPTPLLDEPAVKTIAGGLGVYHGYKRTGSVLWALLYGIAARTTPVVTGAVVAAQGFGQKKGA